MSAAALRCHYLAAQSKSCRRRRRRRRRRRARRPPPLAAGPPAARPPAARPAPRAAALLAEDAPWSTRSASRATAPAAAASKDGSGRCGQCSTRHGGGRRNKTHLRIAPEDAAGARRRRAAKGVSEVAGGHGGQGQRAHPRVHHRVRRGVWVWQRRKNDSKNCAQRTSFQEHGDKEHCRGCERLEVR